MIRTVRNLPRRLQPAAPTAPVIAQTVSGVASVALRVESDGLGSSFVFYRRRRLMLDERLGIDCNDARSRLPHNFSQSTP
jgi:hypothetical protein